MVLKFFELEYLLSKYHPLSFITSIRYRALSTMCESDLSSIKSVMDFHFFYVYYDGETYYHELNGLSYEGSNQKQKCVKVKRGIGLINLKRRILKAMGLDQSRHNISIVYRAPQLVVGTQVVYKSLQLSGGAEVKMMWEVVEQMVVKGFVASELYVTVEPTIVEAGEGSQHIVLDGTIDEHIESIPLQSYQGCAENTEDRYDNEPWQTFPGVNSTEEEAGPQEVHEEEHLSHDELHGGTFENEDDYGVVDDATHIDVTRDDFEEFLDTMGEHEDVDHIEDMVVEENRDTCPGPDPTPEWFTKNTWDNIFDPSPTMQAEVSSWTPGEQPLKGMVFATKLAVRHALTWYAVRENFSFKTEHSDSERLMVSCEDDSCPWSVRAICCKGDNVWKIAKCKGSHTCDKIQNAHDGWMIDSVFLAYVLEVMHGCGTPTRCGHGCGRLSRCGTLTRLTASMPLTSTCLSTTPYSQFTCVARIPCIIQGQPTNLFNRLQGLNTVGVDLRPWFALCHNPQL
ncbi:hypothetical protein CFP56_009451 [Quercus suber]|uniref:Transposase MuDR plant domain-containing protein n=1 Tax=Quercus suber TaxID=58331 RepID=A0AAW0L293_QUESU